MCPDYKIDHRSSVLTSADSVMLMCLTLTDMKRQEILPVKLRDTSCKDFCPFCLHTDKTSGHHVLVTRPLTLTTARPLRQPEVRVSFPSCPRPMWAKVEHESAAGTFDLTSNRRSSRRTSSQRNAVWMINTDTALKVNVYVYTVYTVYCIVQVCTLNFSLSCLHSKLLWD